MENATNRLDQQKTKKTILKVRAKKILHPNTNKENNENDQCPRPQEYEQEIKPKKLNA